MDPITLGLLLGGGLGLTKGVLDGEKERKDRKQQAETARWAPWTGMQPTAVKRADPIGSTMQGGLAGGMFAGANHAQLASAMAPEAGTEAAAEVAGGGGMSAAAPAQSFAPAMSPNNPNYNAMMLQKYPWLAMQAG